MLQSQQLVAWNKTRQSIDRTELSGRYRQTTKQDKKFILPQLHRMTNPSKSDSENDLIQLNEACSHSRNSLDDI